MVTARAATTRCRCSVPRGTVTDARLVAGPVFVVDTMAVDVPRGTTRQAVLIHGVAARGRGPVGRVRELAITTHVGLAGCLHSSAGRSLLTRASRRSGGDDVPRGTLVVLVRPGAATRWPVHGRHGCTSGRWKWRFTAALAPGRCPCRKGGGRSGALRGTITPSCLGVRQAMPVGARWSDVPRGTQGERSSCRPAA